MTRLMPGVFGKLKQQRHDACRLLRPRRFAVGDLADQAHGGLVDKVNQGIEHLRLVGKVALQGSYADTDFGGQACRGHACGDRPLQHGGLGLQNLQTWHELLPISPKPIFSTYPYGSVQDAEHAARYAPPASELVHAT